MHRLRTVVIGGKKYKCKWHKVREWSSTLLILPYHIIRTLHFRVCCVYIADNNFIFHLLRQFHRHMTRTSIEIYLSMPHKHTHTPSDRMRTAFHQKWKHTFICFSTETIILIKMSTSKTTSFWHSSSCGIDINTIHSLLIHFSSSSPWIPPTSIVFTHSPFDVHTSVSLAVCVSFHLFAFRFSAFRPAKCSTIDTFIQPAESCIPIS